jgi:phosphatidylglycerophosphatase B
VFIVVAASILFAVPQLSAKGKTLIFVRSFAVLAVVLSTFAYLNEHLIKPSIRVSRPSHTYIIKQSKAKVKLDSIYMLAEIPRKTFFHDLVASDTVNFKDIDQRILDHWVEEAGYSFPSGHSFNAFLLAGILAFAIYQSDNKKVKVLFVFPLMWAALVALSRVAVGAHSPLDVSIGGGMGLLLSFTLVSLPFTRDLLIPKKKNP